MARGDEIPYRNTTDDKVSGFGGRLNEMTDPSRHSSCFWLSGSSTWIAFKTRSRSVAFRDDVLSYFRSSWSGSPCSRNMTLTKNQQQILALERRTGYSL